MSPRQVTTPTHTDLSAAPRLTRRHRFLCLWPRLWRSLAKAKPDKQLSHASPCAASALRCALIPLFVEDAGLGRGIAILSGVLSVFYIGALETEIRGGVDGPFVALSLLAIVWMSMRLWRTASWQTRTPWGFFALCGFSALLNPQVIPVIAGIIATGLCACAAEFRKRFLAQGVLTVACIFLFLLPWGIRNWMELDSFILTRSNFGLELWVSNGPDRTFDLPTNYGRLHPLSNRDEAAKLVHLGEVAYNKEKLQEATSLDTRAPVFFWPPHCSPVRRLVVPARQSGDPPCKGGAHSPRFRRAVDLMARPSFGGGALRPDMGDLSRCLLYDPMDEPVSISDGLAVADLRGRCTPLARSPASPLLFAIASRALEPICAPGISFSTSSRSLGIVAPQRILEVDHSPSRHPPGSHPADLPP